MATIKGFDLFNPNKKAASTVKTEAESVMTEEEVVTEEEIEVADAAAKLAEIFENATYEQIGGLTLDALVYNKLDKSYELKVFSLSDTFLESDLADPTYAAGENGGLKVTYAPDYVGYRTDGGWSDFSNAADGYAAVRNAGNCHRQNP